MMTQMPIAKKIPRTTLCCIDCINHDLAIAALQRSMASCLFDRVLFLTDRDFELAGIETVQIPTLRSRAAYSSFVLRRLADYIATDYVLLVQWDGYVINAEAWRDEFYLYDYIGAVWGHHQDAFRVGNGGFSLRSKKLLIATQNIPLEGEVLNEDELICRRHRPMLEADFGIRFATEPVAELFSFELTYPGTVPLGFHGLFNVWLILGPAEVPDYIGRLPSDIVASRQFFQLGVNYRDLRQFRFAQLIFRRIVALDPNREDALRQLGAMEEKRPATRAMSRNEPCPCGSGRRYKNCCGTNVFTSATRGATRDEDVQWLLSVGSMHHQHGHLMHAAATYRLVLYEQPGNPIAMRYLGEVDR